MHDFVLVSKPANHALCNGHQFISDSFANWILMEILVNVSTELFVPCVGGACWHPLNAFGQFGEIHYSIWRNTVCTLDKYIGFFTHCGCCLLEYPIILLDNLEKCNIVQFGEIHFQFWRNTFCNLEKYILVNNGSDVRFSFSAWVSLVGIGWMRGGCQNWRIDAKHLILVLHNWIWMQRSRLRIQRKYFQKVQICVRTMMWRKYVGIL